MLACGFHERFSSISNPKNEIACTFSIGISLTYKDLSVLIPFFLFDVNTMNFVLFMFSVNEKNTTFLALLRLFYALEWNK